MYAGRAMSIAPAAIGAPLPGTPTHWEPLFDLALRLLDDLEQKAGITPVWTFGGGTVLMLRYRHRRSKDVDIFVPDPQYLGYVTPRLSDVAESITSDYVEAAGYVKLILPFGEIDVVASSNLTADAHEKWELRGRIVNVESAAEIVAKKMWRRGDSAAARDLFDLALVIQKEPAALTRAARFLVRHRDPFLDQLRTREAILREGFDAIDTLDFHPTYEECVDAAREFLGNLPALKQGSR